MIATSKRPHRRRAGEQYLVLRCLLCRTRSILRYSERTDKELCRCEECGLQYTPVGGWR